MSMRSTAELIRASQPYARENPIVSWSYVLSTLAILVVFLAIAAISAFPIALRAVASVAAALVIVRGFILYHDYQHGAILRKSPMGRLVMGAYGILILNPPNVWNRSHNYHHSRNAQMATASIGSFPVMTVEEYMRAPLSRKIYYILARHPMTILFGYVTIFILGMCLKSFLKDPKRHWDSAVSLVLHAALVAGIWTFAGPETLVLAFLGPIFVACALGGYLFYAQHNFPECELRPRTEWDYGFAALRSSSYMQGGPLMHWLTGNIGYHHVHHLNATIPFYRLPEAMAAIPELHTPGRTSLKPRDIWACLRLKLWDPARGRLVSFSEA